MSTQQPQGGISAPEEKGRFNQAAEDARERLQAGVGNMTECVSSHPGSAMLVTFGVGFGIGLLIGHALSEPSSPPSRWYDLRTAEKLGRRILDNVSAALPDSLSSRLMS